MVIILNKSGAAARGILCTKRIIRPAEHAAINSPSVDQCVAPRDVVIRDFIALLRRLGN